MTRIAGLDDSGRGPVLGPLVIAGLLIDQGKAEALKQLGVRDSKKLSPSRRRALHDKIIEVADSYEIVLIEPKRIDEYVNRQRKFQGLNLLEAEVMAEIVERLKPEVAYVDASDVDEKRYGQWISERLTFKVGIISEHHADSKYPVVSASSILAKVRRDDEIGKLKTVYGDFGSGYAGDPRTIAFLKDHYRRVGDFPPFARRSWKTLDRLAAELHQRKLLG